MENKKILRKRVGVLYRRPQTLSKNNQRPAEACENITCNNV